MDDRAEPGRRRFARLRAWNRRSNAWSRRHPWRHTILFATTYVGVYALVGLTAGDGLSVWFYVGWWVFMLGVGAVARTRVRTPGAQVEPVFRPSSDLTLSGSSTGMGDDGRRWRTGSH